MTLHEKYLKQCFELAIRGRGRVSPNPLVGALIVKNNMIIGKGWHEVYGGAHAEVNAFLDVKEDVSGADLYCNLEPCCHEKKQTPPCVPLIILKKIKRVIISNLDPNPQVAGKGVEMLRQAGINVITGVCEADGELLNRFYFTSQRFQRPFITLKIAQSIDGKISRSRDRQTWLTGEESARYVHQLRSEFDAVLVGANTVTSDDPQLNVRHVAGRNPQRIIVDGRLSVSENARVIGTALDQPTWILTLDAASPIKIERLQKAGVRIRMFTDRGNGQIGLLDVIGFLHQQRMISVLIEGGQAIFTQFIQDGLFDEIIILQAPVVLGSGLPALGELESLNLRLLSSLKSGNDLRLVYSRV